MTDILVINWIVVEPDRITVGATTQERWDWEIELGRKTGVDAATLVYVTLTDPGEGYAVIETAGFHVGRDDALRQLAVNALHTLFDAAWWIKDNAVDEQAARDRLLQRPCPEPPLNR